MGVAKGTPWNGQVPFDASALTDVQQKWLLIGVDRFNTAVNRRIWVPRNTETDYVRFQWKGQGHNSPIGKQGGAQTVEYAEVAGAATVEYRTLHHEMGHALGLGHENFNSQWPLWPALQHLAKTGKDLQKDLATQRLKDKTNYRDVGTYDANSIMLYSDQSFLFCKTDADVQAAAAAVNITVTPQAGQNPALSAGDIAAILTLNAQAPGL